MNIIQKPHFSKARLLAAALFVVGATYIIITQIFGQPFGVKNYLVMLGMAGLAIFLSIKNKGGNKFGRV